jgi:hypothetical protein
MNQHHWPLHPKPIDGEALSSWLDRVAAVYDLFLEDLLLYDLGYEISAYDLDFNPPNTLLEIISQRSHLSFDQVYRMTFRSWVPFILDHLEPVPGVFEAYVLQYPCLLPTKSPSYSIRSDWRPWLGNFQPIRACQVCATQPEFAMHLSWKLPLMVSCPLHRCRLQPCAMYSRKYVYWKEEEVVDRPVTKEILTMDIRTQQALMMGKVDLARRSIHAGVWFRFLRSLLNELSLPLSYYRTYAAYINKIWNTCDYPIRAGLTNWKPYEYLPLPIQMMLLEAAATTIGMLETGRLSVSRKFFEVFKQEPLDKDNWHPGFLTPVNTNNGYQGNSLKELLDQAVAEARTSRESAQNLRAICLWGRKDPKLIKEIDSLFLELGIPFEFS